LTWTGAGITNPLFYHVYKKPQLNSDLIERKLTNTLEATGNAAGVTKDQVLSLASSLQEVTKFGDETAVFNGKSFSVVVGYVYAWMEKNKKTRIGKSE
jgi:hypothetical protein